MIPYPHIRRRPFERACEKFALTVPVRLKLTARAITPIDDDNWSVTHGTYRHPTPERDHHLILLNSVYLPAYRASARRAATIDKTLFHELQHALQFEQGRFLASGDVRRHDDPEYLNNPSEIDARSVEGQADDHPNVVVLAHFRAIATRLWTPS